MARTPSDGCGVPLAMWIRPSAPSSSAVQPIAARTVSELRSGCRRNRQASSTASAGIIQASEPNAPVAAVWMARPAALPIRPHSEAPSTMATPREQPHAVPAVVRVQVARAAADGAGGEPDRAGRHRPGGRDHAAGPPDQDHDRIMGRPALGGAAFGRTALRRTSLSGRPLGGFFLLARTRLVTSPQLGPRAPRGGRFGGRTAATAGPTAAGGAGLAAGAAARARAGSAAAVLVGFQQLEGILG